ncbi:MAG: hypothetical protein ACRETH_01615 [Steroidobacteraceae bacterium]
MNAYTFEELIAILREDILHPENAHVAEHYMVALREAASELLRFRQDAVTARTEATDQARRAQAALAQVQRDLDDARSEIHRARTELTMLRETLAPSIQ